MIYNKYINKYMVEIYDMDEITNHFQAAHNGQVYDNGYLLKYLNFCNKYETNSEYKKQIEKILENLTNERDKDTHPQIRLHGQRLRAPVLFKGLRLLWFRAAKPKWATWRLGAQARFSESYSKELDPTNTKRLDRESTEIYDRLMMTKITTRALKKYEAIAENAARGKFPCEDFVEQMDFNYPELAQRIKAKNTWEANTKKRLQAESS